VVVFFCALVLALGRVWGPGSVVRSFWGGGGGLDFWLIAGVFLGWGAEVLKVRFFEQLVFGLFLRVFWSGFGHVFLVVGGGLLGVWL